LQFIRVEGFENKMGILLPRVGHWLALMDIPSLTLSLVIIIIKQKKGGAPLF
jgi:hypothetical protein